MGSLDILDSILDKEIDDLKDLPSFKIPDTGIYKLSVWTEPKAINEKAAVVAHVTVRELIELADSTVPEEERAKAGDKFDVPFMLQDNSGEENELGFGRLKEFVQPFQVHFGEGNLKRLVKEKMTETNAVDITAQIKKVARKGDKEKFDARISDVTID